MSIKKIKFGDLFGYENKSKIKAGDGLVSGQYPFFTSSSELSKYLDEYSFDKTCLIFGTGGNASIHYCETPFSVSTDCLVVFAKDENVCFPKFVFYYLFGNINILEEGFKGAGLKHISKGFINEIEIPLPPLPSQKRIAEILDAADALKRKDQALLKKYDELAQAIFIDMFGDPVKNEKGYEVKRFDEVVEFPSGLVDPKILPYTKMYHVGGDNIESATGKIFGLKITSELALKSGKFYFTNKHILYNKIRPKLNKVACPDFEGICSADMYPLLPKDKFILKEYIYFILKSESFLDFADKQSRRANIPKINMNEMSEFEFPIPPMTIQVQFKKRIKITEEILSLSFESYNKSSSLFQTLIQKAFKGELVA